jgi:SAM-dependent methyltransferase
MESDLYHDPDLAQFYDLENDWAADLEYCRALARADASVLDLGCGTGRFAAALGSAGHRVVGVDPAEPMLDIARRRPGGETVRWLLGDARTLRLDQRFDLIVLTGHAFQVFLTAEDRCSVLRMIARHLAPQGRFVFDSRNPAIEAWKNWTPSLSKRAIRHSVYGDVQAWNDVTRDETTGTVTYGTHYRLGDGRIFASRSQVAFPVREEIAAAISEAGLVVERWLGDWIGAPWSPASKEIIPIGRLR